MSMRVLESITASFGSGGLSIKIEQIVLPTTVWRLKVKLSVFSIPVSATIPLVSIAFVDHLIGMLRRTRDRMHQVRQQEQAEAAAAGGLSPAVYDPVIYIHRQDDAQVEEIWSEPKTEHGTTSSRLIAYELKWTNGCEARIPVENGRVRCSGPGVALLNEDV